jgi:GTP-binding protein HflX
LVSDTVGFIKKLPHDLVASFRSTLDEALDASLLLYVVDASDPSFRSQLETTKTVLSEIGATSVDNLLILNKEDRLSELEKVALKREFPEAVFLSTINPASVRRLRDICVNHFEKKMADVSFDIPYAKSAAVAEIHSVMRVLEETHDEHGTKVKARGFPGEIERIKKAHKIS